MNDHRIRYSYFPTARGASRRLLLVFTLCLLPLAMVSAANPDYPVFVSEVSNPNDYSLFANGGWDGNWYVGYNNGWVKKLPSIPAGNYSHAYVGAKLGRMKTRPPVGRPPEFNPIAGEIWIGVSSTPSWTPSQRFRLTTTDNIPQEGSAEYALDHVGESEWFWTEVPLESVNRRGDNFLVLWSTTAALMSVSSSPVLAAAWGGKDINTWIVKDLTGEPPEGAAATKTGLSYFQPALALKLIPAEGEARQGRPEGSTHALRVRVISWINGTKDHPKPVITASAEGDSIERLWVEYATPARAGDVLRARWDPVGRSLWKAPYTFSIDKTKLPHGKIILRIAAANVWEEKAYSDPFEIEVSPIHATP